jgi:magnesium transporter
MADTEHTTSSTTVTTSGGLSRAIAAPMRAESRIFTTAAVASSGPTRQAGTAIVDCGYYVAGERQPSDLDYAQALAAAREIPDAFLWLGLHEPTQADLEDIAAVFELDEFAVEDATKGGQRAKIEQYGGMTFLAVRTARYIEHAELTETSEIVETGDLMMFIGPNFVITVRHGEVGPLAPVRAELERKPELLALGPWSVVYSILDRIVDTYLEVCDQVQGDIDEVESLVFAKHVHGRIARIYQLKREVMEFKRAVVPLQRPLGAMVEGRLGLMPKKVMRYFRDVNDHLLRSVEQVVSYDDLLNSILQARLAQVTVDQNHDMRKIAAWAAIAAAITAITGIYGMNFAHMPELDWLYGYPAWWAIILLISFVLYRAFRRNGWL